MSLFEIILIVFVSFISVYALVDRICKCIENKANAEVACKVMTSGGISPDIKEVFNKFIGNDR